MKKSASGKNKDHGPDNYILANDRKPKQLAAETARIFMGIQIQCAECHDHKLEPLTRSDYYAIRGLFESSQVIKAPYLKEKKQFAAYMEAWRSKVERIGNLNYPDEARRARLSGNLLLDVSLNPDGTINDIVLRRSSGKRVLDDAAVRIVKLAAPYGKFPASISTEVDILHIQRTWQFSTNNRFASR